METLTIPEPIRAYFPKHVDPANLWVNYSAKADSLTIYFAGKPEASIWTDIDEFASVGMAQDDEKRITGLMIEHFSKWLVTNHAA